jgi:hypothetical protein
MSSRPASQPRRPAVPRKPAVEFRDAIEKAEQDGVARDDMLLKLTLSDASELKRDRTVATADISFVGGTMRYLGVKVSQGGVTQSTLDTSPTA